MPLLILKCLSIKAGCSPSMVKNLREDKYVFAKGDLYEVFFARRVSVSAIVGMNGSGKSTLLDILLRVLNNFGAMILKGRNLNNGASLLYVDGVYADLDYSMNGIDGTILCRGKEMGWKYGDNKIGFSIDDCINHIELKDYRLTKSITAQDLAEFTTNFFNTIVSNFSFQAFIDEDYIEDKCYAYKDKQWHQVDNTTWIHQLFCQTDEYLSPLSLYPMRNHGIVDVSRENEMVNYRLASILTCMEALDTQDEKDKEYLDGYRLQDVVYFFSKHKLIYRFKNEYFTETQDEKYERLIGEFRQCCSQDYPISVANIILSNFKLPKPVSNSDIHWAARFYLVQTVLMVAARNYSYALYSVFDDVSICLKKRGNGLREVGT